MVRINLTDYGASITPSTYYRRLAQDESYNKAIQQTDKGFIQEINSAMIHDFRDYQEEALAAFDFFMNQDKETYPFKEELFEKELGERSLKNPIPFYGFEMATGSGKTLIMGALILYLHKKLGKENFLIITRGKTIYKKTIKNFDMNHKDRIFSNNLNLDYNVVTGENYMGRSCDYDEDADFNVFIFNMGKFFERTSGDLKVKKAWEQSHWTDERGNTISLYEYLQNDENLTILTDEAHHFQKFRYVDGRSSKSSGDIIVDLKPNSVLEFTATALTDEEDEQRRNQKIIYNYPLNKFITDGYGKKVRAYGYPGSIEKTSSVEVTRDDKEKFLVSFMIHLVKKEALKDKRIKSREEGIKPILLTRARDIEHADNLVNWICDDLPTSIDLIEKVYNYIVDGPEYDITELIKKYVSLEKLKEEIKEIPEKTFAYHNENDNDEEIQNKVETIETNDQEVLVQIRKLEEGWDLQNPYTILILSVSKGNLKTYVKQLIGRGLRLFREKREKGDMMRYIEPQQEILHVVCEKGDNFNEFIEKIRKDLGLSKQALESEKLTEKKTNKTEGEFDEYNKLEVPHMEISNIYPSEYSVEDLISNLSFEGLNLDMYIQNTTLSDYGNLYWPWEKESGTEIILENGESTRIDDQDFESRILELNKSERDKIVRKVISSQNLLPSSPAVKTKLKDALKKLEEKEIRYKMKFEGSRRFCVEHLITDLSDFLVNQVGTNYVEKKDFSEKTIGETFEEFRIDLERDPDSKQLVNLKKHPVNPNTTDVRNFYFTDFERAYYEYNSFDSKHEYMLAYQFDLMEEIIFWIRNMQKYYLEYGVKNRYHPDFFVKTEEGVYIIEVKGEGYLDQPRTEREKDILLKLRERGYWTMFLVDTFIEKKIYKKAKSIEDLQNYNLLDMDEDEDEENQLSLDES